ncbi:MAG: AAA family ATPase, partial [Candidatus Sulfopaludibacter sp.]|nr:AAA family ATPase [Candidatus Sulfopaludibacter sp.]
MGEITLPPKGPGKQNESWKVQSVVITGANGSGKTRLGVWIEDNNPNRNVHRIAAQRALNLPDLVNPMPYERATSQLYYGSYEPSWNELQHRQNKIHGRWGGQPVLQMLSDYELVVSTLFAEEARRNRAYTAAARDSVPTAKPKDCSLDSLQRIWLTVFPHRELIIGQDRISARIPTTGQEYAGRMMSDGERVAFYLLGQVLCAPPGAIIVVDEPEIHLHRAIQSHLWDEAETSRPDCVFVYVTHDLEFAASRTGARKIWTRSFDGTAWEWEEVEGLTGLPDEMVLQILGNRRPVLFVEGDAGSFDSALYRALYQDRLIFPVASCQRVIGARRGMQQLSSLHNLEIEGLVDRDHRSDEEIAELRGQGIMVADVAEVENLFCVPSALIAAAKQLKTVDSEEAVQVAKARVLSELQKGMDVQVAARAIAEIQFRLRACRKIKFTIRTLVDLG